jgi:hypothetical protein
LNETVKSDNSNSIDASNSDVDDIIAGLDIWRSK